MLEGTWTELSEAVPDTADVGAPAVGAGDSDAGALESAALDEASGCALVSCGSGVADDSAVGVGPGGLLFRGGFVCVSSLKVVLMVVCSGSVTNGLPSGRKNVSAGLTVLKTTSSIGVITTPGVVPTEGK